MQYAKGEKLMTSNRAFVRVAVTRLVSLFPKAAALSLTFALVSMAFVTNDWRNRDSDSWTLQDINEILSFSPWVRDPTTTFRAWAVSTRADINGRPQVVNQPNPKVLIQLYPVIRLLTGRPIRDAYLRWVFIEPPMGLVRDAKEAMEQFAETHSDDIGIKGDPKYIVVSVTFAQGYQTVPPTALPYVILSDPLAGVQQSDLAPVTYLTTPTGKHITLDHYVPLGEDNLGAKFYFPRNAPNGAPIIVKEDKELSFESRIKGQKIQVRFNLKDLVYQGKLEL